MSIYEKEIATVCNENDEDSDLTIEIDSEILKKTIHCTANFKCLGKEDSCPCLTATVKRCVDSKILFVKCSNAMCMYHMSFGNTTICNCPTRMAIYKKYKK